MRVLGIETSCDETALAIYDTRQGLMAHRIYSQVELHREWGGVVPELASRDHIRKIAPLIRQVLHDAACKPKALDGIAYTQGPGLIGALMVGAAVACSMAYAWQLPVIGVHHLEAHLMVVMLEEKKPRLPFVALLVSGGHTLLIEVSGFGKYRVLGESLDDAAGEAFDKTAKLLGLPYPGGPALAELAEQGNAGRFHFPRPMLHSETLNFSFSGLKTHVAKVCQQQNLDQQTKADIACAFQEAVVATLLVKCQKALAQTAAKQLVVAGGVGANRLLRQTLSQQLDVEVFYPRTDFCTDNGAMVAYAGWLRLSQGEWQQNLAIKVHPRWPLANFGENQ